jgi:hypothetical protein
MSRRLAGIVGLSVAIVVAITLGLFAWNRASASSPPFKARPLLSDTADGIGDYAKSYARAQYRSLKEDPEVRLVRPVTWADLESFGFGKTYLPDESPHVLVILHAQPGGIDLRGTGPGTLKLPEDHRYVAYIGLVFDQRIGLPAIVLTSPKGGYFRKVLNDPTLPDDFPDAPHPASASTPGPVSLDAPPVDNTGPHDGSAAPPVLPPTPATASRH